MSKISEKLIYNKFNVFLGNKVHRSLRRLMRSKYASSDDKDIYFLMRKWIARKEYDQDLVDKYRVKAKVNSVPAPKNLFEFDSEGNVTNGQVPSSGKVVLKHNSGSNLVKIVDVSEINKEYLKKLYKRWYLKGKYYGLFLEENQYLGMKPICFGEEFLGENIADYKIHYFNETTYRFLIVKDRFIDKKYIELDQNFSPIPNDTNGLMYEINDEDKKVLLECLEITKKASKQVGNFYFRADYFSSNGKIYLGEITLTNSAGRLYHFKGKNDPKVAEAEKWMVENYKKTNNV